ncbi:MAG TPA: hypothetical protein VFZ01_13300 [Geminicoccaceae bacterium]
MPVALALTAALPACSTADRWMFGPEPDPATRPVVVTPLPDDEPYPSVATVPPKPQLSYTVEQKRAIVDALVADQKNARYTSEMVRYRSGVNATPPELPEGMAALRGEDVIGAEAPVGPALPGPVAYDLEDGASSDDGGRTLEPEAAQLDDGSLDDFVRGLVDETDAEPDLGTDTALLDRRNQDAAPIPGRKGKESAFAELFVWIGQQLGGAGETDPATQGETAADAAAPVGGAVEATGEATGEGDDPAGAEPVAPAPAPAEPERTAEPPPDGLPRLKPDEGADPPAPAPAKPEDEAEDPEEDQARSARPAGTPPPA